MLGGRSGAVPDAGPCGQCGPGAVRAILVAVLVFIDESGCSGFKLRRGSDSVFAAAMVTIANGEDALAVEHTIKRARMTSGHKTEFRFSKCSDDVRDAFFMAVRKAPFKVRAIVVEKDRIYSPHLRSDSEQFYRFFVKLLGQHDGHTLRKARIRIDGSGNREFRRALASYMRRELGPAKIQDLKMADSKRDPLIQLADMCVGAIARSYRGDSRDNASRSVSPKETPREAGLLRFATLRSSLGTPGQVLHTEPVRIAGATCQAKVYRTAVSMANRIRIM
jgi:hypothetical protein